MVPSGRIEGGRRKRADERAEDFHDVPVALSTHGTAGGIEVSHGLPTSDRWGSGRAEEVPRAGDRHASLPVGEGARVRLTRRTVSIATRVVGQTCGAAVVTRLPTPAEEGGAARRDRAQRERLDPREPMSTAIRGAVGTHDVGEGETKGRNRGRRP